ncbi:hypothetical protein ACOSQ2_027640 [Xanthoceras sorbifolium]
MPPQISIIKFNILVVDDDCTSLNVVSSMLRSWKYEVTTVKSPLDALATIQIRDIDLVVTDLHMPKMNGLQLQKQIEEEYKLPVMIMSSDDDESLILKSLSSGAAFYIVKPVNPDDLKNVWQYSVASKQAKFARIDRIGSLQGQGGSLPINEKISYSEKSNSASSVNGEKHGNRKDGKRKSYKKNTREDVDGENSIASKKAKVVWTNSLHNRFLQAIRHITLEKAVPKKILEFMNVPGLTRENVASHLQKYRIFLKRVAEKGFAAAAKNSMSIDRTFRSSFAAGHSSLLFKTSQDAYSQFNELEKQTSAIDTPFQSNFHPTNFGSIGGLSNSNSVLPSSHIGYGQSRLLGGSTQATVHKSILSSTNPIYQLNRTGFGPGSNDIGTNMLSRSAMSDTNSMQMPHTNSMQMSSLYNNIATPSLKEFRTSGIWNPSYGTLSNNNESIRIENVSFSNLNSNMNYFNNKNNNNNNNNAGIQINSDGELLVMGGQTRINGNGINGAHFGLINGAAQTQGLGVEAVGVVEHSTFGTCLAPGESSSASFNHGNQQFSPPFSGVNEQGSTSQLPSMAPQQEFGLGNNEQNDFLFDLMNDRNNDASVFDSLADPQPFSEFTDLLKNEPTNYQLPYHQQQGGEDAQNHNFASNNSSYPIEMNPPISQPLNDLDFPSPFNVECNRPWNEPSLEQGLDDDFLNSLLRDHPY